MQMIQASSASLWLLLQLSWDRILYFAMLALCLTLSAYVVSLNIGNPFIL